MAACNSRIAYDEMDSFSQRILDSIDRRYETYQLSTSTSSLKMGNGDDDHDRDDTCAREKENLTATNMQYHAFHQTVSKPIHTICLVIFIVHTCLQ